MKIVMAKMATDLLSAPPSSQRASRSKLKDSPPPQNHAQFVADACVRKLAHRAHTTGGLILLDREGHPAAAFNTARMAYGFVEAKGAFRIAP
jgi:isoaspartyl peptidase/L-asparaginase-like protein (Ntn-hydrolase superfamily)